MNKKYLIATLVSLMFLLSPLSVFAGSKSIESVKGAREGAERTIIYYERLCLGGLEFVSAVGGGWGQGVSINPVIIQVMGKSGKPKPCK